MNNKFKKLISVSLVMLLLITSTSIFSTSVSAATTYNMKVGETITTQATQATTPAGEKSSVFLQNDAGWSTPYCYMWNSESDKNAAWPGVKMTDLGEGVFECVLPKSYSNLIFNGGSNTNQTGNLTFPGVNNIYNNKTGQWEPYSAGPVKISSFTTDVKSPSYTTCGIKISASAKSSEGDVTYKFSVNGTVLSDGADSSVVWVPTSAGDYTITVDVTDTAGNENSRSMSFVIKDASTLESVFIRAFSNSLGTNVQIKKNSSITFTNDAIGGAVGTNLLFYKFVIIEPDGATNIPYYTLDNKYTFTPSKLGVYTIKAYVQNSMNVTTYNTYQFNCVDVIDETPDTTLPPVTTPTYTTAPTKPTTQPTTATTAPTTAPQPTECDHATTKTVGAKSATYFAKGNTGDKVCAVCGEVIEKGRTIAAKILKTPKVTVKPAKKAIKVTYKKVKDAKGFMVTYKLGKKTYNEKFTLSKKQLKKAKVTKTIKVKKYGKYKVTVKAFVTSGKKIAYSKPTKTVKVKVK